MAIELTNRDREIASKIATEAFLVDPRGYQRRGRNGAKLINYRQMPRAEFYHAICDGILQSKTPEEAPADGSS